MPASNWFREAVLNWIKGTTFPAVPASGTSWVALHSAAPLLTAGAPTNGTSNEIATGAYTRKSIATGAWSAAADSGSQEFITNSGTTPTVTFPTATAAYTVTHVSLWDSDTGGVNHMIGYVQLATPRAVAIGDTVKFDTGTLDIFAQ